MFHFIWLYTLISIYCSEKSPSQMFRFINENTHDSSVENRCPEVTICYAVICFLNWSIPMHIQQLYMLYRVLFLSLIFMWHCKIESSIQWLDDGACFLAYHQTHTHMRTQQRRGNVVMMWKLLQKQLDSN